MGGFVEPRDHGHRPIAPHVVGRDMDVDKLRETHDFEILDRSKGDEIAKAFAFLQTAWFMVQCIARRIQALPLAELEVITLAFSALNIIIYIIWWHKPLDVRYGVPIGPPVPLVSRQKEKRKPLTWEGVRKRMEYLAVHLTVDVLTGENENDHIPSTANQVPMLWAGRLEKSLRRKAAAFGIFLAMGFGAIHFVAWNVSFPSKAELILWRVAAITIVIVPFIFFVNATISVNIRVPKWFRALNFYVFIPFGVLTYMIARVALMVLPILSLRSLPDDVYRDITWTKFIPHIS